MPVRSRAVLATAALAGALAAVPAAAPAADYRPGQVVVRYAPGLERSDRARVQRSTATMAARRDVIPRTRVLKIRDGSSVMEKVRELRQRPGVLSATPNYVARASAYIPNDPGTPDGPVGGWQQIQWNFMPNTGINAPDAWDNLIAAGRPGGSGVMVAVLDTGVAYRDFGKRFRRSPDLTRRIRRGYDFVDNDPYALDHNGHGTHVASTIAESVNNGIGLTGIAYGAQILPVRVLDRLGEGDSVAIAAGIRFAAKRGAHIINLSFEFSSTVTRSQIPDILSALRYAQRRNVLVIGASGNAANHAVAYPARASRVVSVGAVTEHSCQADYSNTGAKLDLSAPGGGADAIVADDPNCRPDDPPGRDIVQMTFAGSMRKFGLPRGYMGTSMAAPHVSATAALVIASGLLGRRPTPAQLERHLKQTADDLGKPGPDPRYGAGRVNAARATTPSGAALPPA
ncbi:MAG TPA: S8 family serine peptidase [Solirubrobacteraceae bacterium]|nr:S8 family serine peptidase [Solirubrobacteraceae bacterium]